MCDEGRILKSCEPLSSLLINKVKRGIFFAMGGIICVIPLCPPNMTQKLFGVCTIHVCAICVCKWLDKS